MASKISEYFDVLIVGSSFAGIVQGLLFEKEGLKVGYVDSQDALGGPLRPHTGLDGVEHPRFPTTLCASDLAIEAVKELQKFIPELSWQREHVETLTWDSGELRPFVGFGKHVPVAVDVWSELLNPDQLQLNLAPEALVRSLDQLITGQRFLRSQVTAWETVDNAIDAVQINNRNWVKAARYFFCDSAFEASRSALGYQVPARTRQRWSKTRIYSSLGVVFRHGRPIESTGSYLFQGGGEDINPCLGKVKSEQSIWMALMPYEFAEDYDNVYQELKKIKRLVKRVWPDIFAEGFKEVVIVQNDSHGWIGDPQPQALTFDAIKNVTFMMPEIWSGPPLAQALYAGFSQNLCAPAPTVLTHLDI